jgi:hypothetical protein
MYCGLRTISGGTGLTPNESGFVSFGHFGPCESGFGSQFKLTNPDLHGSVSDSQPNSRYNYETLTVFSAFL